MSYMLQFPPSSLPKNITSPPYVLFGINDLDAFSDLPTNIPLALILHFAPSLRQWILPPPELSAAAIRMSLRTPYVGINVLADIEVEGLAWILARMMQIANIKVPAGNYKVHMPTPNLMVSIAIHKAWTALDLPPQGIEALHIHIQTTLMAGPPVSLFEARAVWHNFPTSSIIRQEMGSNFMRNYIDKIYPPSESSAIRHWYLETTDRWSFFKNLEKQYPAFQNVQRDAMKTASERQKRGKLPIQKMFKAEKEAVALLEKEKADRHRAREERRKEKSDREDLGSRRRLERARSNESLSSASSVETVIWNPLRSSTEEGSTTPTAENAEPYIPHSQPVDSSVLTEMLREMAIKEQPLKDHNTTNRATERKSGEEKDLHNLEYIPPGPSILTKLKLKLKPNLTSPTIDKKPKPRRSTTTAKDLKLKHSILVEKASATVSEVLSPKSRTEKGTKLFDEGISSEDNMTQLPRTQARPLNHNIVENANVLVYLQPTVYKGTR